MSLFVFILSLTIIGDMSRTGIISISYWMDREIGTERLRVIELASNRDRARMWCLEITHIPHFSGFHYTLLFKPCIFSLTRTHWLSCKTIRHRARKTLRNHIICPLIRRMILPPIRQKNIYIISFTLRKWCPCHQCHFSTVANRYCFVSQKP